MRANHQGRKERNKPSQDVHYGLSRLVSQACDKWLASRNLGPLPYNGGPKKTSKEDTNKDKKR